MMMTADQPNVQRGNSQGRGRGRGQGRGRSKDQGELGSGRGGRSQRGKGRGGGRGKRPYKPKVASTVTTSYTIGLNPNRDTKVSPKEFTQKVSISNCLVEHGTSQDFIHCSRDECLSRQELGQVSMFEATRETCALSQENRVLDAALAVTKYRRSAAGTDHESRSRSQLRSTLSHLISIVANQTAHVGTAQASLWITIEFAIDRLRACQADAIRISATETLEPTWHLRLARTVAVLHYLAIGHPQSTAFFETTCRNLVGTSLDLYWAAKASAPDHVPNAALDDEVICYTALQQYSRGIQEAHAANADTTNYASIIWDSQKYKNRSGSYPLWSTVVEIIVHSAQEEYRKVIEISNKLPNLGRCFIAPILPILRYKLLCRYNVAFAKSESVPEIGRLLVCSADQGIEEARNCELPINDFGRVVMKQSLIQAPKMTSRRYDDFVGLFDCRIDSDGCQIPQAKSVMSMIETGNVQF